MCACCDDNNNSASRMLVSQQSDLQTFRTRSPSPSTKSSSVSLVLSLPPSLDIMRTSTEVSRRDVPRGGMMMALINSLL
jgi:hypothetical protein